MKININSRASKKSRDSYYQDFIKTIAYHQTERVKALNIPNSSCPSLIPKYFNELIPDIMSIIEEHFDEFSDGMRYLAVFGLQPAVAAIKSYMPIYKNRIFSWAHARNHLCCVLYFLPVDGIDYYESWGHHKSVVIDFTRGTVIDHHRYLHTVLRSPSSGKIYGRMDAKKLKHAWRAYKVSMDAGAPGIAAHFYSASGVV